VLRLEYLNRFVFTPTKLKSYVRSFVPSVTKDADDDPFGWGRDPEQELEDVELFIEDRHENIKKQIEREKQKPYFQ